MPCYDDFPLELRVIIFRLAREAWYSSNKYLESQKKKLTKKCKNCKSEIVQD